jgi:hypothetical protein
MNRNKKHLLVALALIAAFGFSYVSVTALAVVETEAETGPTIESLSAWYASQHPDATPWETCEQDTN